ncbi:MAG: hypothetical protein HY955_06940 [Deltaproteobacteria bacterium]|nr:hypothetical protein [Deltaproteobacteria bacterium]
MTEMTETCVASVTLLAPTTEEAEEYCLTEEHYRCPLLLGHVLRSGAERAYSH